MRIAVIGSWRNERKTQWNLRYQESFEVACHHIGGQIAAQGCTLLMPQGEDKSSAEHFVRSGLLAHDAQARDRIEVVPEVTSTRTRSTRHIMAVRQADAVILIGGTQAAFNASLAAIALRKRMVTLPIFGGAAQAIRQAYPDDVTSCRFQLGDDETEWVDDLASCIRNELQSFPRLLLVHGRSLEREAIRNIILSQRLPGLAEPLVIDETACHGGTVEDEFDRLARKVDAAIVIATSDVRPNTWLEFGWFWGALGLRRIMLVYQDAVALPSGLQGLRAAGYGKGPAEAADHIVRFITDLRQGDGRRPDPG